MGRFVKVGLIVAFMFPLSTNAIITSERTYGESEKENTGIGLKEFEYKQAINLLNETSLIDTPNYFYLAEATEPSQNTSVEKKETDISWIITEPLGGLAGAGLGTIVGTIVGVVLGGSVYYLLTFDNSQVPAPYIIAAGIGGGIGTVLGLPFGIWSTGKYLEKENGSFKKTLLGTLIGGTIGAGIYGMWYKFFNTDMSPGHDMNAPLAVWAIGGGAICGGVRGFKLSLPKE
ncbi:MAG: hypothetical protein PHX21_00885 [bacterium]|nr:hypothetical protein [bacterium]